MSRDAVPRRIELSSSHAYWIVVAALLGCTLFFVTNVQLRRAQLLGAASGVEIESGLEVRVVRVIDVDQVAVKPPEGNTFVVQLVGIKGFPSATNEPGLSGLGRAGVAALRHEVEDQDVTVVFDQLEIDREGRVVAYLEVVGKDVGELLIQRGLAVAYTKVPFSREEQYLGAEAEAESRKRGLWGNPRAVARVQGWRDTWRSGREP